MYKIALVNMPLANLDAPSIALTQLRAVVLKAHGDRVSADVRYLNHEFAHFMSLPAYRELDSFAHHPSGLGEWFFRPVAFPDLPDNSEEYFRRYYPQHDPHNRVIKEFALERRAGLAAHFDEMIDRYGLDRVDLLGLTSMFSQNVASIAMARRVKARNPKVLVVIGGANCEGVMGRRLADSVECVDFVFSGASLKSFPEFVRLRLEGDEEGCHRLDGVFSRRNRLHDHACASGGAPADDGGLPTVRAAGPELDINEYVELDYGPFLDAYEAGFPDSPQPALYFETSRGCWWGERAHCTFCGLNGSTLAYRAMRPELAFRMLGSLFEHRERCSDLSSVDNILPRSYLSDVLPYLDTPPTMKLFYEVKADLTEPDFRVLQRARVLRIQPGIESLNTGTLKLMRKGTSVFQNLQFLMNCVRYGISPVWNLLIGFPGEEIAVYEKYLADIPLLTHLPPPGGVFPIRFDRFSPYFDEAEAYGLELKPLDWYAFTYPFPAEALAELAYYFSDHHFDAPYATNAARMVMRLRQGVDRWTRQWARPELRPRLSLHAGDGFATVFDSRSGTPEEYAIGEDARLLLEALATPKKIVNLVKELPGVEVEAEMERLRERALVFHEGDRWLSLILTPPGGADAPRASADRALATA